MSNPPYPPSNPGDSNQPEQPGAQPAAPQYGQQSQPPAAPQYGQPAAPQYGQQTQPPAAPQYGQPPAPQYGQTGASPYGQAPQYGQDTNWPSQQPGPATVPQMVNIAFWLIIGAGAIWLISILISMAAMNDPSFRSMFEDQMSAGGAADVRFEDVQGFIVGVMVALGVIGAGLYALVAINVRKGRNWARILGTVLAALSIFALVPLSLATLSALLGIAAIVLLYLPASAPYFRKTAQFGNPYQTPSGR
ncbi:hypothetical protein [Paenarthrobacter histidinolovorans]|uniref:hypothetical protein n=1 Tax=Paenarthrobacter histidinolovorans TaxID=43664 RepID=UPI00166B5313|nr:hypothetical protein [Paenarthrobacter histidinolovorans]GGJ13221.1 hypothetical protein GCM10010052_08400 [Paenarthrobacter histidinolovorans]